MTELVDMNPADFQVAQNGFPMCGRRDHNRGPFRREAFTDKSGDRLTQEMFVLVKPNIVLGSRRDIFRHAAARRMQAVYEAQSHEIFECGPIVRGRIERQAGHAADRACRLLVSWEKPKRRRRAHVWDH